VDRVSRSVVNVSAVRVFHDMFYQVVPVRGVGSGVIIDPNGHIITNSHVVAGAEKTEVTLTDGTVLPARMIGACRTDDIATLKVEAARELPTAELGDSDKLRVGQMVFAIGNPFGLAGGPTVTAGVISALNRSIQSERGVLENLVQTDAAINPGNSGGPLVDTKGRVVAINTAIVPFAQGIGFAIPINTAKRCSTEIITHGRMVRPWLGISGVAITREIASYYDLPVERGVLVAQVVPDSPADYAGIRPRDIILRLDDAAVNSTEQLASEIQKRKTGSKVNLMILRGSTKGKVEVTLGETP